MLGSHSWLVPSLLPHRPAKLGWGRMGGTDGAWKWTRSRVVVFNSCFFHVTFILFGDEIWGDRRWLIEFSGWEVHMDQLWRIREMQPSTQLFVCHVTEAGNRGPLKTPKVAINDETKYKWTICNFHDSRVEWLCERLCVKSLALRDFRSLGKPLYCSDHVWPWGVKREPWN